MIDVVAVAMIDAVAATIDVVVATIDAAMGMVEGMVAVEAEVATTGALVATTVTSTEVALEVVISVAAITRCEPDLQLETVAEALLNAVGGLRHRSDRAGNGVAGQKPMRGWKLLTLPMPAR